MPNLKEIEVQKVFYVLNYVIEEEETTRRKGQKIRQFSGTHNSQSTDLISLKVDM